MIPKHLDITLTERCNFRCGHCYGNYGIGRTMPYKTALNCVRIAARHGIKRVILTGGEPILVDYLADLIQEITRLKLYSCLCTNGSDLKVLKILAALGLREVHISFDKWHADFISIERVKYALDYSASLGIIPVLVIIEANSLEKYKLLFGDYLERYHTFDANNYHGFKPLVYAGRAKLLDKSEFKQNQSMMVQRNHPFNIYAFPDKVSFCPINDSLAEYVDLNSDWLSSVLDKYSKNPAIQALLGGGINSLMHAFKGSQNNEYTNWTSQIYECNFCMEIMSKTNGGRKWPEYSNASKELIRS